MDDKLKLMIEQIIDQKMSSMENMAVPNHGHNSYDSNQLDPAVALLGFPVIQVADATVAPNDSTRNVNDLPTNGTFRFYVDSTPRYRLWAYLVYVNSSTILTGAWKSIALT